MALLIIFLMMDVFIAYYLFRQAFVVRSNMNRKYKSRFWLMLVIIGAAVILQSFNLPMARLVAGIPACAMIFFAFAMGLAMIRHKGPWH